MVTKNQELSVEIESLDGMMNGVAHIDGQAIFIPGALPHEKIIAHIVKTAKNYAFARIVSIQEKSPDRVTPPCPFYKQCGGCSALHMRYETSLLAKQEAVRQNLSRIGGVDADVPPVLGMEHPFHYRNKTAMPVSMNRDIPVCGFYSPRSHRLIPVSDCLIAKPESTAIANAVLSWMKTYHISAYDEWTKQGLLRHIVSRVSTSGESMAVIVVSKDDVPHTKELCALLRRAVPSLCSICLSVNARGDNVILGTSYRVLDGTARLSDTLCGFHYSLSPLSFFQINPLQTEKLYQTAIAFADPKKDELAVDLYCGAGTISLLLAQKVKRVIGIEIVPQAIDDARMNAKNNQVTNAEFQCGAAEDILPQLVKDGLRPDLIVMDPPRKGVEPQVLSAIVQAMPKRVVYVSCDPATQARDIRVLTANHYQLDRVQPVDMFCWTSHVETVVLMSRAEK